MRLRPDPFIVALLVAALVASFLPATGSVFDALRTTSYVAIGLLFFLYGARLSTAETLSGLRNWRLHSLGLATTFVVLPLLGLAVQLLEPTVLTPSLASGVLLLSLVPSTVQASVVYARIAGGNTAGAVVSASLSNLLGVFLTPALVALLMSAEARVDTGSVLRIVLQLFAPFVAGQVLRPLVGRWVERRDHRLRLFDRGAIVLVVLVAFSEGAEAHIWSSQPVWSFLVVAVVCAVLLVVAYGFTWTLGRLVGFTRSDRIALLFCGSMKSLASGLPIASVLFTGETVALLVLPLMLYHQMQIISGAVIAGRLARPDPEATVSEAPRR